jgi:hypothetical protein
VNDWTLFLVQIRWLLLKSGSVFILTRFQAAFCALACGLHAMGLILKSGTGIKKIETINTWDLFHGSHQSK